MANITSLIVKIGAQDAEITAALAKLGSNVKRTDAEFKKLGSTPVAQQAQQSLKTLDDTVKQITTSQQRLADRAKVAAAGLTALGGPARVTKNELEQINRTIQNGLDAYRALGQKAPAELQKVADAVTKQRRALSGGTNAPGAGLSGLLGSLGISTSVLTGAGIATALTAGAKAALDYADSLTKLSDRTGIGVVALQRLGAVADASGNDLDQIASSVNAFQKRLVEDSESTSAALSRIGLTVEQLRALSPDEQFFAIARGIQSIKDPAEQTRTAMDLFGKSGAEILPSLKANVDELADATVKMSERATKALDDFGDSLGRVGKNAVSAIGNAVGEMLAAIQEADNQAVLTSRANQFQAGFRTGDVSLRPGGAVPAGFDLQAKIAQTNAAIAQSGAEAATVQTEVTRVFEAQSQALRQYADVLAKVIDISRGYEAAIDSIDGRVVEAIGYYREQGVALSDLAKVYELTETQVWALGEAEKAEEATLARLTRGQEALTKALKNRKRESLEVLDISSRPIPNVGILQGGENPQLAALKGIEDLDGKIQGAAQAFGVLAQVSGDTFGGMSQQIGIAVAQMNALQQSAQAFGVQLSSVNAGLITVGLSLITYLGNKQAAEDRINDARNALKMQAAGTFADASNLLGNSVAQPYIDAIQAARTLEETQKRINDLVAAMNDRRALVSDALAAVGPSQTQLEDAARRAREVLDLVTTSGQRGKDGSFTPDYNPEQQARAYYNWQKAMADAGNAAAKAWVAAQDAADGATNSASKAIDELRAKRDGLAQSVANEAPEEVMGVIEAQIRGQIAALDAQLNAQQDAVDENTNQATDAAATVQDTFKNCWTQVGQDGKSAADAIAGYFSDLDVVVKVRYDYGQEPIPGAATGGRVTGQGVQRFATGGVVLPFLPRGTDTVPAMLTPGEVVLNAAQQRAVAGQLGGGPSVGAINVSVYPAAGEDEQALATRVVSALRTNAVLYEAVSVVSKRAVA